MNAAVSSVVPSPEAPKDCTLTTLEEFAEERKEDGGASGGKCRDGRGAGAETQQAQALTSTAATSSELAPLKQQLSIATNNIRRAQAVCSASARCSELHLATAWAPHLIAADKLFQCPENVQPAGSNLKP